MQLLERDELLLALQDALASATKGEGRLVALTGEAGAGKSALVRTFLAQHPTGVTIRVGACDPLTTPRPLGPLQDMATEGTAMSDALQRGLSPATIFALLLEELRTAPIPTVLVVEDAHWADAATLDLLRYLARRIIDVAALIIVTSREDEGSIDHPTRIMLGDVASGAGVARHPVPPLSQAAVRRLTEGSSIDAESLFRATGGNPFYVTEVLAAAPQDIPVRVVDAVLARAARLPGDARSVLEIASVMRTRLTPDVLTEAAAGDWLGLDACLLSGMLVLDGHAVRFRHEIARRAVEAALAPMRRRHIHRVLLGLLEDNGGDADTLAYHAHGAGDTEAFLRHARQAAERAAALGAHREAAAHLVSLLEHTEGEGSSVRAELLDRLSFEHYLTGRIDDAIAAREQALASWRAAGDVRRTGDSLRWLSRLYWFATRETDATLAGQEAVAVLEPESGGHELGMAYSNMSQLAMLRTDAPAAKAWSAKALELAEALGDTEVMVHALNNLGTASLDAVGSGIAELERSLSLALQHDMQDHAGRAYANLMMASVCVGEFAAAARYGEQGIAYCVDRDLDAYRWYLMATRARLGLLVDDWSGATADATAALRPDVSLLTRAMSLVVLARIATRCGDDQAGTLLSEAFAITNDSSEPQRLAPVFVAHAEAAWLRGKRLHASVLATSAVALQSSYVWERGEVSLWLTRLGHPADVDLPPESPFALSLAGDHAAAHDAWITHGRHYEAALAAIDGDDVPRLRAAAVWLADRSATRVVQRASARLRELGSTGIRLPRPSSTSNSAGLTQREVEVLALVAAGLPDRDIAERLVLSQRTIHHHVAAVLRKLQVTSRRDAGEAARNRGVDLHTP